MLKKLKEFGQKAINSAIFRPIQKKIGEKGMNALIITAIVVAGAAVVGVGSWALSGKEDNPIEEQMENVIENQTGLKVDLSPSSPEKR